MIQSKEWQTVSDEYKRTGEMPKFDDLVIEMKAPGDAILTSGGTNSDALAPNFDGTLRTPGNVQYPLKLAALMNIVQSDSGSPTISYPVVTTRTAPTGNPTTEGEDKKGADFAFDVESATLIKNTAFSGASDEMFTDAPRLVSWINEQVGLMVLQEEEANIAAALYAAAIGNGVVTGAGIGGVNGFDAIREAMALIETAGGTVQGIGLHPNDAAYLDVLKATGGDENYYSGGPLRSPLAQVWGSVPYATSTAFEEGAAVVGAFRSGATLYRRGGLRVETSNSHSDYFRKDKVAIRAYLRSVTAVHYPEWFIIAATGQAS
jgi:HK97 family phage major capsid protein